MKTCTKCGIESDNFGPDKCTKDGLSSWCRTCYNIEIKSYRRTRKGLVTKIYGQQRSSSRIRGHSMPEYEIQELREWIFGQNNFENLYTNWVESGYDKMKAPSCDRIDDYKPYSLDNIQLMTWEKNDEKGHRDRKNGINNKNSKAVIGTHKLTGEVIEFHSQNEASRITGIEQGDISSCCRGIQKSAGGYVWRYKN